MMDKVTHKARYNPRLNPEFGNRGFNSQNSLRKTQLCMGSRSSVFFPLKRYFLAKLAEISGGDVEERGDVF